MKLVLWTLATLWGSTALAQLATPPLYQEPAEAPVVQSTPAFPDPPAAPAADLPVAAAKPANVREIAARLQIFLDQKQFGPGKIDGEPGEFTAKALARYLKANGLPAEDLATAAERLPLDEVSPIYAVYVLTEADLKRIGPVPRTPAEQAKLKRMPYPSVLKFLEERFHCSPVLLQQINPGIDFSRLIAGDAVRVPNVIPFEIEAVRETGKLPPNPAFKDRVIKIDTREKMLDLFEGDTLLASFPITPGSASLPAPVGKWRILGIATLPWFRHDEGVLKRGVRTKDFHNIPAGPSNPVGVVWIGLNKPGIGIHGTNNPQTIGRAASHGCVRLANWDAIRLAGMITQGMTVYIDEDRIPTPSPTPSGAKVSQTDR